MQFKPLLYLLMRLRTLLLVSTALLLAVTCDKKKEEPEPQPQPPVTPKIEIPSESQAVFSQGISIQAGTQAQSQTVKFTATAAWSADVADTKASSWLSVQPTSGSAGAVTMTVTAQPNTTDKARSSTVTIQCGTVKQSFTVIQDAAVPQTVAVESVTLNKTELTLEPSGTETLTATVAPENATDKTVTWSTSNAEIATVADGKVTAVKEGEAVITAKAGEKQATCKVTVKKATVAVESVTLNKTELTLEPDGTETLIATIKPDNATDKTVTWSTSNAEIANVADGKVTAVKEGEAIITAKAGEKQATCKVTVKKGVVAVTSVTLNKDKLDLKKGEDETLVATVAPDDATDKTVTWSSSDATIASVDQTGKVTAVKSGKATITAAAGEKSATCSVTVTTPVQSVSLDRTSVTLEVGQMTTLFATVSPNDADEKTVTWTSSNVAVASIAGGVVTAMSEGTAVIKASVGGKEASCTVTVQKAVVAVTSVTMNKSTLSLTKDQSETLTATVAPENATDKTVTWSSSDATIASVDQTGKVTAVKSGKATITAAAGEKSVTCEVTITTPVQSVSLDLTTVSLEEGQTTTLMATISPNDADEQKVTWSTSNSATATVANGVVTAVAEGTAVIKASAGGKEASCTVTVKKGVVAVTSVTLNKTTLPLTKGQSETLTATVTPDNATDKTVTWSSSDATIASVDQTGKVTAVKSGKATITAAAGEKSATCEVTVTTPVQSVSLDRTTVSLEEGQTTTLTATISPNDADEQTITWSTSNSAAATVTNGFVTAVAEGTAVIKASVGGKEASCTVTVKKSVVAVTSVTLNKTTLPLTKGQSEKLTATVAPDNATDKTVTWSSSDATIASVDQTGKVTAVKSGKATITAAAGEKSATCEVTVTTPVQSVSLDRTSVSLEEGQTTTLTATISPNDADEQTITWSTSNSAAATVTNGFVTAVAEGTAVIKASVGGKEASCTVTVKKSVVAVTSVTLNKTTLPLTKGQSEKLTATVAPDNATDKTVTWSSSDATIASVDQTGKVTAVKSGKATITAAAGEKSATCEVTVTNPVTSVSLNKTTLELEESKTFTLIATINPTDADEQTVAWTTSNAAAATVVNGVVTAVAEGTAVIKASVGGKEATCTVTVKKAGIGGDDPEGFEDGGEIEW